MVDFREAPGLGSAHPLSLLRPLITHPSEHNSGTMYLGSPSIILGHAGQEEGEWWPLSDLHCARVTPQTQLAFSCPRQLGSVRHECLSSSLTPEGLLWEWQQTTKLLFLQDLLLSLYSLLTSPGF